MNIQEMQDIKIGDRIRIEGAYCTGGYYQDGDILTAAVIRPTGVRVDLSHKGASSYIYVSHREIAEVVQEQVAGPLEVGDKVEIVRTIVAGDLYSVGDILTVNRVDGDGDIYVDYRGDGSSSYFLDKREYVKYSEDVPEALQVGDTVKCIDWHQFLSIPEDGVFTITSIEDTYCSVTDSNGITHHYLYISRFEKVEDKIEIGDWVILLDNDDEYLTEGQTYKVLEIDEDDDLVIHDDDGDTCYVEAYQVKKASADATALQQARENVKMSEEILKLTAELGQALEKQQQFLDEWSQSQSS